MECGIWNIHYIVTNWKYSVVELNDCKIGGALIFKTHISICNDLHWGICHIWLVAFTSPWAFSAFEMSILRNITLRILHAASRYLVQVPWTSFTRKYILESEHLRFTVSSSYEDYAYSHENIELSWKDHEIVNKFA